MAIEIKEDLEKMFKDFEEIREILKDPNSSDDLLADTFVRLGIIVTSKTFGQYLALSPIYKALV